ncbi:MAG: PD-(D/E)XK nuclease family protein [Candidatus Methylumidiphilus sp.]
MKMHATPQNLQAFFDQWSYLSSRSPLEQKLQRFFDEMQDILPLTNTIQKPAQYRLGSAINLPSLESFLLDLTAAMPSARRAGFLCNPWEIASLKRDEVRNSSVLAWWLNPVGSHGYGDALLSSLLGWININHPSLNLPATISNRCSVRVESSPDGDTRNRVDVEIDDQRFLLCIEVKIDAGEGRDQVLRYCQMAASRAGGRPWALLFLTPQGRRPEANPARAENDQQLLEKHVISLSWRQIAFHLEQAIKPFASGFVALLARAFCQHIRKF